MSLREHAWALRWPLIGAVVVAAADLTVVFSARDNVTAKFAQVDENAATLQTLIDVQVDGCREDRQFRRQYRIRGKAEKKLLALFVSLAANPAPDASAAERQTSADFIAEFEPLLARLRILPVPDCERLADHLHREFRK